MPLLVPHWRTLWQKEGQPNENAALQLDLLTFANESVRLARVSAWAAQNESGRFGNVLHRNGPELQVGLRWAVDFITACVGNRQVVSDDHIARAIVSYP